MSIRISGTSNVNFQFESGTITSNAQNKAETTTQNSALPNIFDKLSGLKEFSSFRQNQVLSDLPQNDSKPVISSGNPEYITGADGKRVSIEISKAGKISLGANASEDLKKAARLIEQSGSQTLLEAFQKLVASGTKIHFKFVSEPINNGLLGLHQPHDKNGNELKWKAGNNGSGTFDGQPAYIKDKSGKFIYKEATITIFEGNLTQNEMTRIKSKFDFKDASKEDILAGIIAHEIFHDIDETSVNKIMQRQRGTPNNYNVEDPAYTFQKQVYDEIKEKRESEMRRFFRGK